MSTPIDVTKTYRTRDGRPVQIYRIDRMGGLPVYGASFENGQWRKDFWGPYGEYCGLGTTAENPRDLIEAPILN